ncbi:MAG: putative ABC transport system permease protein [Candidatus Azotimanducaceae bacterium]|jgi:putative ABC transport system permease protein
MSQLNNILRLSFRDYSHEWRMSGCFVFALASVLAPMMILFGLKFGIVSSMISGLVDNPVNREIRPIGSGHYSEQWVEQFRLRPEVEFIIPKTRALAATIQLKSKTANHILSTEMMATALGDPSLKELSSVPKGYFEVILSKEASIKLKAKKGQLIDASLARQFQGKRERVHLTLKVIEIAEAAVSSRNIAFVNLDLLLATEQFKDGRAVPELGWLGDTEKFEARQYPSFRLYAKSIYDVNHLVTDLEMQGIRVKANTAEIYTVQSIDQNLSVIFWIIACVGAVGFAFSLGASLWANVDRKKKELSILRLLGFRSSRVVLFPLVQSCLTGLLGWLCAVLIYLVFEQLINRFLAPRLNLDQTLCFLLSEHFFWALGLTMVTAILAAILGGFRAAKIEPSDGLREI